MKSHSRHIFSEAEVAEFRRLYEDEGWTHSQIAEKFHCHRTTVGAYLNKVGVDVRRNNSGQHNQIPPQEIRKHRFFYEQVGLNINEQAELFGMSSSAVQMRLRKAGCRKIHHHETREQKEARQKEAARKLDLLRQAAKRDENINGT